MTFTHVADASEDDNWDEDEIQEGREEEEPIELDDDDDDLWLQEKGT